MENSLKVMRVFTEGGGCRMPFMLHSPQFLFSRHEGVFFFFFNKQFFRVTGDQGLLFLKQHTVPAGKIVFT